MAELTLRPGGIDAISYACGHTIPQRHDATQPEEVPGVTGYFYDRQEEALCQQVVEVFADYVLTDEQLDRVRQLVNDVVSAG